MDGPCLNVGGAAGDDAAPDAAPAASAGCRRVAAIYPHAAVHALFPACMQPHAMHTQHWAPLSLSGTAQFATFLFFAGCVALMTIAIAVLLPETKGVPIEEVNLLWERHFVWRHALKPRRQEAAA